MAREPKRVRADRVAFVRALKGFENWERGEVRSVYVTERVASLIVSGYLEELYGGPET